ncbi:TetR family transcriptional regulator [Photobacterium jeanii]|uniref:TetR family transcriptional regulator n=1 Tax=Photobacterium jeanii TaxID=858640 RepID=A0A178KMU8_9GAMM|nr:TetR/AcrR family transcriptional regulator [Photobacterium jeanii]OAN18084.1 TetR family transcriptional regulator [Photobacterium jeanii]PST92243.1 TetR/AcrR family transcriptional regulator [Photobacterium jeanii]
MATRSEQKKEQILGAATQLFFEQGYGVSMDAIADLAQVSKQTVYAHFKTKDELFETCIRAKCVANQIDGRLVDDPRPIQIVLTEFVYRFQALLLSDEACQTFKAAVSQSDTHPQLAQLYLNAGPRMTTEMLAQYLALKDQQGEIKLLLPAEDAAMQLLLMAHGKVVYWAYLGQSSEETDAERYAYLNACVEVFLRAHQCNP